MLKIVDTSIPPAAAQVNAHIPEHAAVGQPTAFSVAAESESVPALNYTWDFGDGTSYSGAEVRHTFTHPGTFTIHLKVDGLEGIPFEKTLQISVSGIFNTTFDPQRMIRRTK